MQNSSDTSQAFKHPKTKYAKVTRTLQQRKLLKRTSGVTITELQKTFGWQPDTVRAAIPAQRKSGATIDRTTGKTGGSDFGH